jgi:hypothetical protein
MSAMTKYEYLSAKLERERPDIFRCLKAGEFRTIRSAALAAKLIKPTMYIPVEPKGAARCILRKFTDEQVEELIGYLLDGRYDDNGDS